MEVDQRQRTGQKDPLVVAGGSVCHQKLGKLGRICPLQTPK